MLAISGADLVGKSTFARRCVELLQERGHSHALHHLSRVPETWRTPDSYAERMCVNSVWDRFHLDELAYRQHDDRRSSMTPLSWDLTEAAFRQHCGFQVVLWATDEEITERHAKRGDPIYSLEHILKVNRSFKQFIPPKLLMVRGQWYRMTSVDLAGNVHTVTPEKTVDAYESRLAEFAELQA